MLPQGKTTTIQLVVVRPMDEAVSVGIRRPPKGCRSRVEAQSKGAEGAVGSRETRQVEAQ